MSTAVLTSIGGLVGGILIGVVAMVMVKKQKEHN